jgi:putative NADH-flavin reductase
MKAILFGATGMVGQGVLRECLLDSTMDRVLPIIRNPTGQQNAKLTERVHKDFFDFSGVESQLTSCEACFYCAGPAAAGMTE